MDDRLYIKTVKCPVCSKNVEVTKVKSKTSKVLKRDSDFCTYYEGINPLFYDVWICEHCGYAAQMDKFETATSNEIKQIQSTISPRWHQRSFSGERNMDIALEAFKLALLNLQVKKAKASEMAKVCLRIAWLYRFKEDEEKEKEFLSFALRSYREAYERESFPADKLDENTCMYMIAELYRRVNDFDESVKWFSRLISSPDARRNAALLENAREQFQLVKEQMSKKQA